MAGERMTPAQTARDIVASVQLEIPQRAAEALLRAVSDACEEEECIHRILIRSRSVIQQHVVRCHVQADADAALGGTAHPRSEQALLDARELLASIEARLGVNND